MNMAMDEVLLRRLDAPLLRIYRWARPAVSFGYFEKFEPVENEYPFFDLVRRWTGGGVVSHGDDLTYSLLVPINEPFMGLSTSDSYRAIHERIAGALRHCGLDASAAVQTCEKISQACFENKTMYDIMLNNRKIAGAAQRRTKLGLLHQGSIQVVKLPVMFAENLATNFSAKIVDRKIQKTEIENAMALSESKYATGAWTRKF